MLILNEPQTTHGQGHWSADPQAEPGKPGFVALASFHPRYPGDNRMPERTFKLVLDCSGSMGGDAMRQAKQAVREILNSLKEEDRFNLTAFGSHYQLLFPRPRPASPKNIEVARRFVEQIDADMGGTEIGEALLASYRAGSAEKDGADLLLITDGEIWDQETILQAATQSGHRIFSIGVGSAVSEGFVRAIAEKTGGACELVSPREKLAEHILRHFRRIRQPAARGVQIHWPVKPRRQQPKQVEGLFAGDTLHLLALMDQAPQGEVVLEVVYGDGTRTLQNLALQPAGGNLAQDLPRLAAHARLETLKDKKAKQLAVDYQLLSEHTSCVLVKVRAEGEKATESAELRKVPQMLAAGWGGLGAIGAVEVEGISACQADIAECSPAPYAEADMEYLEAPAFLRRSAPEKKSISLSQRPSQRPLHKKINKNREGLLQRFLGSTSSIRDERSVDQLPGLAFSVLDDLKAMGVQVIQDLLDRTETDLLVMGMQKEDVALVIEAMGRLGLELKRA